jgi:hypothetical protein
MVFTVTASPKVQDELAEIYLQAVDKNSVSKAANEIDQRLKHAPLAHGVAQGSARVFTIKPVTVIFRCSPDDCLVEILKFAYQP